MTVVEFLKKYQCSLSLSGIEKKLGIPLNTLKRSIKKDGSLPRKHELVIAGYFPMDFVLSTPPVTKGIVFDKSVALDMSEFEFVSLSVVRHVSGVAIRVIRRGGDYYPR